MVRGSPCDTLMREVSCVERFLVSMDVRATLGSNLCCRKNQCSLLIPTEWDVRILQDFCVSVSLTGCNVGGGVTGVDVEERVDTSDQRAAMQEIEIAAHCKFPTIENSA